MIRNKIHIISPVCPWPSVTLQCRIICPKTVSFICPDYYAWWCFWFQVPIVKLVDSKTDVKVDISYNLDSGLKSASYIIVSVFFWRFLAWCCSYTCKNKLCWWVMMMVIYIFILFEMLFTVVALYDDAHLLRLKKKKKEQ